MTIRVGLGIFLSVLLVVMACGVIELLWRFEHTERDEAIESSAMYSAKVFYLPENSVLPYGHGIFVKHRSNPFWFLSKLAFAGYCGPRMSMRWRAPSDLRVECTTDEALILVPVPEGISVNQVREPESG